MGEEACFAKPGRDWLPRLIVIDGCNIGRSACGIGREAVNCAGLMAVIRWLLVRDFDVVAFLPVIYNNSHNYNVVHVHLLTKLEELGLVTFTPARTGRGDRKAFINYDDLYVTTLAARHGGCVLSGDKFKDILAQPAYSEFHPVILNRTLDVKFHFLPYDVVYHKLDVFYKALPELFIYEDVALRAKMIAQKIFASPDDPEFSKVLMRRELWNEKRKDERINAIDDMIAELCEQNAIRPLALENLPGYQMIFYPTVDNQMEGDFVDQISSVPNSKVSETIMDDAWTDTTSSNATMNVADHFASIDFYGDHNVPATHSYQEELSLHPTDPFDMISESITDSSEDSAGLFSEVTSNGISTDDINGHPNHNSYSQEYALEEIVPYMDTLIITRDRIKRKQSGSESSSTSEVTSFSGNLSYEPEQLSNDSMDSMDDDKQSQRFDDIAKTSDTGLWPVNTSLEEEISYSNSSHDESDSRGRSEADLEIEVMLMSIFPVNIVRQVLSLNVSRNIDFLADQCAELCA